MLTRVSEDERTERDEAAWLAHYLKVYDAMTKAGCPAGE